MMTITRRDQAIHPQIFRRLEHHILGPQFPWYYTETIAYQPGVNPHRHPQEQGFKHLVSRDGEKCSPTADLLDTIMVQALGQEHPDKTIDVFRIRIAMLTPGRETIVHDPHVDCDDAESRTALVYLTDSDGDTLLYKEHWRPELGMSSYDYWRQILGSQVTTLERITPRANRMITFPGTQYHSSTAPSQTSRRIVINVNYLVQDV